MADYYIDPLVGNDANAGTSPGAGNALASISGATAKAGTGHRYFLQDAYHVQTGTGQLTSASAFTKSDSLWLPYPAASNLPVIDGLKFLAPNDSGWLYVGNGIWSKNCAVGGTVQEVDRLFIDSRANSQASNGRTVGYAYIKGFSKDGLNRNQIWWSEPTESHRLYVYTGSATQSPPEYYQGLAILQRGNDASPLGFRLRNLNNFRMEYVTLRGLNGLCIGSDSASGGVTTNVELANLTLTHTGYRGIDFVGAAGLEVIGVTISNLNATDSASIYEREEVGETHYGGYELIEIAEYCQNITLENFVCNIGHGHGTIALSCVEGASNSNVVVRNGVCTAADWTKDTRGFANRRSINSKLQNVIFSGFDEASHIEGNGTIMEDCIWKNFRRNKQQAGDGYSPIDLAFTAIDTVDVTIRRTTFDLRGDNDVRAAYKLQVRFPGSGLGVNAIKFYDNLIFARSGQGVTLTNVGAGASININQSVYNNIVVTASLNDAVYNIDGGNNYDVVTNYGINAYWQNAGALGATGNAQHTKATAYVDDASYRILSALSPLKGTATFTSNKRDAYGNVLNNPPDKGGIAYRNNPGG